MRSFAITVIALGFLGLANGCDNPKVQARSYTSTDAQILTHIPFIAEFTLTCSNGEASIPLYASINGALTAVQKTQDGKKYQVAWTQEVEKAKAGDVEVNLYDDSGYSAMKRVLERGDDAASVKPLVTIVVNHPGAYKGPIMNSEHLAGILAILVFYCAYTSKANLLA